MSKFPYITDENAPLFPTEEYIRGLIEESLIEEEETPNVSKRKERLGFESLNPTWWRELGPDNEISEQDAIKCFGVTRKRLKQLVGSTTPGGFTLVCYEADDNIPFPTYSVKNPSLISGDLSPLHAVDILTLLDHELIEESEPDEHGMVSYFVKL